MSSIEFYKKIISLDEIEQEQEINIFAKDKKVTKTTVLKAFNSYKKTIQRKEFQKKLSDDNKSFQALFKMDSIKLPENYTLKDGYICYADDKTLLYLTKIFAITSRIYTKENTFWTLTKSNNKTEIIDSRDFVKNDRIAYYFADNGEVLSPQKVQKVSHFISEFLRINEHSISHRRGLIKTGWNNNEFCLPSNEKYLFLNEDLKDRFKKTGNLENQIRMLQELSNGKAFLLSLFSLSSVFQGILELPLNYICHIGGLTGEGKSFSVKTAVSLFGRKDAHKYGKNWNSTLNGLETYFDQMQDIPSWVDEVESAGNLQSVIQTLYTYSEGTGKGRARIDNNGNVVERETKTFRGNLFTTGEKSLWDIIQTVGKTKNRPLGLVRRSLDLDSVELWKGIDRNIVGNLLNDNQGHFIYLFINIIKKYDIKDRYNKIEYKYKLNLDGKENLFYILILTLELLFENNIIDDISYSNQMNFIFDEINNSNKLLQTVQDSHSLFIEELYNYISNNRFKYRNLVDDSELKGVEGIYQKGVLYIATSVCTDLCDKFGFVRKQIFSKLFESGILLNEKALNKKTIKGSNPRCFNFKLDLENVIDED